MRRPHLFPANVKADVASVLVFCIGGPFIGVPMLGLMSGSLGAVLLFPILLALGFAIYSDAILSFFVVFGGLPALAAALSMLLVRGCDRLWLCCLSAASAGGAAEYALLLMIEDESRGLALAMVEAAVATATVCAAVTYPLRSLTPDEWTWKAFRDAYRQRLLELWRGK